MSWIEVDGMMKMPKAGSQPWCLPLFGAIVAGCSSPTPDPAAPDPAVTTLSPLTGVGVPHSASPAVAILTDGQTACTIDSFEARVRCVSRDGATVGVFGGEGEGPGEFEGPSRLARGADGTVGVMDPFLGRFQVFTPPGELVGSVPIDQPLWVPRSVFGENMLVGTFSAAGSGPEAASRFTMSLQAAALSIPSGETVET